MRLKILLFTVISTIATVNAQISSMLNWPASVKVGTEGADFVLKSSDHQKWSKDGIEITFSESKGLMNVDLSSPIKRIKSVKVMWVLPQNENSLFLGDQWERSYGDLSWKKLNPDRLMPWYFLAFDGSVCKGYGVMTGCHSFASWNTGKDSLILNLDTRNGTKGVKLGTRVLRAAEIICYTGKTAENTFTTAVNFCKLMCPKPRLPKQPVYGINDWYFAYGKNSADLIMETVNLMAPLAKNKKNLPFCVIDDGWSKKDPVLKYEWCSNYGEPNPVTFGDMALMATKIKATGMRPGLWSRPLCASQNEKPENVLSRTRGSKEQILDPTVPENMAKITNYFKTYQKWGYEMVKHDYTSYDIFGKWGGQMLNDKNITTGDWNFSDQTLTSAEVVINLYRNIREASGEMYLIGCNTFGHLAAGYFELSRTGDDTSGHEWARTLKMGVNTLAFRGCQQNAFFAVDGDCVGLTTDIPWELNKQWLQLLAEGGTSLFVSIQPKAVGPEQKTYIEKCFSIAAEPAKVGQPINWMESEIPSEWILQGKNVKFNWGK